MDDSKRVGEVVGDMANGPELKVVDQVGGDAEIKDNHRKEIKGLLERMTTLCGWQTTGRFAWGRWIGR